MFMGPGQGTLDNDGNLIEEYARLGAESLVPPSTSSTNMAKRSLFISFVKVKHCLDT